MEQTVSPKENIPAVLSEFESKELLKKAGIPVVETRLAHSKTEAAAIAKDIGFPVVMKIASPDVVHKSDAGGVKVGLANGSQAGKAYTDIINSVKAKYSHAYIEGVSVQRMAKPGIEIIIGMSKDPQFGPVLMFGLGGIMVEIIKDVAFRIVPLAREDASDMVHEIKGYRLLEGFRGADPADVPALEDLLLKVSAFVEKNPQIKELDLNPVFAYKDGVIAVDARIVLEPK
jgi:acetate---CoA ligase (ADP-forming) subunit beta